MQECLAILAGVGVDFYLRLIDQIVDQDEIAGLQCDHERRLSFAVHLIGIASIVEKSLSESEVVLLERRSIHFRLERHRHATRLTRDHDLTKYAESCWDVFAAR